MMKKIAVVFWSGTGNTEAMAQLDGFGLRSTQKLPAAIERARTVDAQHFLFALSIPLCGQDVCRRLYFYNPWDEGRGDVSDGGCRDALF